MGRQKRSDMHLLDVVLDALVLVFSQRGRG